MKWVTLFRSAAMKLIWSNVIANIQTGYAPEKEDEWELSLIEKIIEIELKLRLLEYGWIDNSNRSFIKVPTNKGKNYNFMLCLDMTRHKKLKKINIYNNKLKKKLNNKLGSKLPVNIGEEYWKFITEFQIYHSVWLYLILTLSHLLIFGASGKLYA